MIDDLSKTIKAQLYARINSPLLGSFLLSWATWNYKFIVVLFSAMSVEKTFAYIDQTLYPTWIDASSMLLIGPAITTALLIFVYPYPAKWVYEFSRKRQKELKESQQKIDDETPLTREEAREIRLELSKKNSEFEDVISKREAEIVRLRTEIENFTKLQIQTKEILIQQEKPVNIKVENLTELTEEQIALLRIVASNSDTPLEKSHYLSQVKGDTIRKEFNFGELQKRGLINNGTSYPKATHAGRSLLIALEEKTAK